MATNFEPHECVIFVQSTKIGTHENKATHSIHYNGAYITYIMSLKLYFVNVDVYVYLIDEKYASK